VAHHAGAQGCAQLGCKARRTRVGGHEADDWCASRGWPMTVHGLESGPTGVEDEGARWVPAGREKKEIKREMDR
jgi:hypothetical protein